MGIHSKELKEETPRDTHKLMFTTALFTTAKWWKQPKCLFIDEWINKTWDIQSMNYYSAFRITAYETLSYASTWMDFENIILSELSQ